MKAEAFAKVNLSLAVRSADATAMHPLRSLVQSIDWADMLELERADDGDAFAVTGDAPADESNLAWRALDAVRRTAERRDPFALMLDKQIPAAAGLGGGSADAATALVLAARAMGLDTGDRDALAPALGADVPFCLAGGSRWIEGYGEIVGDALAPADFALAVVVPRIRLSTPDVYRRWDEMDGPSVVGIDGRSLPVGLRDHGPLSNDLTPAALSLAPDLGDTIADLRTRWGVPVAMSGSGSSLFGYFPTLDEATEAAASAGSMRAARACRPVRVGWRLG